MKLKNVLYLLMINVFLSCGTSSVIVNIQRPADISVLKRTKSSSGEQEYRRKRKYGRKYCLRGYLQEKGIGVIKKDLNIA